MNASRSFLLVALLGLGGVAFAKVYEHLRPEAPAWLGGNALAALAVGGPSPEVSAADEKGAPKTLASLRGRPVLLNFWFSDCAPCREEMASLDRLARKLGDRLPVVTLSVDPSWAKVRAFHDADPALRGRKPAYRLWLDAKKSTPPRFGSFKFPETFLIGKDGELVARFVGPRDWSSPAALALMERIAVSP